MAQRAPAATAEQSAQLPPECVFPYALDGWLCILVRRGRELREERITGSVACGRERLCSSIGSDFVGQRATQRRKRGDGDCELRWFAGSRHSYSVSVRVSASATSSSHEMVGMPSCRAFSNLEPGSSPTTT